MTDDSKRDASVHSGSLEEAHRHKWIESEKYGRDLGGEAIDDWYRKYWLQYCRGKRIEHVVGHQSVQEFEDGPSVLILNLLQSNDLLLHMVLDRVSQGWENLELINWGLDWGLPMDRLNPILLELNINCARLEPAHVLENSGG